MHTQILLKADQGRDGPHWSYRQIQEAFTVSDTLIRKVKKRFVQEGLEAALNRKKQAERPEKRMIDGKQEAQIIAVVCTQQPAGQERWTLRALAERAVELEIVESVSHETIRTVLKKKVLKPWLKKNWCVGPTGNEFFVAAMEDVLMAEIELSVLGRQALSGRIASLDELYTPLDDWQRHHNA
jgi:transposase